MKDQQERTRKGVISGKFARVISVPVNRSRNGQTSGYAFRGPRVDPQDVKQLNPAPPNDD